MQTLKKLSKWEKVRIVHPNSVKAYHEGMLDDSFNIREREIIQALKVLGRAADREIMEYLGYQDLNSVRPRLTELINQAGILEEVGKEFDSQTKKTVRIVRIKQLEDANQLTFKF
jgi:LmbE family N-acetylglucosaminyl deacetylase